MKFIKFFLLIVLASLIAIPVHAQSEQPPIPAHPTEGGHILDELDWLTDEQEASINSIIRQLDNDGVAEIAVVALNDCGSDKQAFRKSLFDTWGIGHTDDDDGLLILVCWYEGDPSRRSVEQLYGPGLNGTLTSKKTDQIVQENFVPAFDQGKPGDGLVGMLRTYNVLLRTSKGSNNFFTPLVQFFKDLNDGIQAGLLMLLGAATLLVLDRIIPNSLRSKLDRFLSNRDDRFLSDHDNRNDRDGFGGGKSDGGGGSSTRF